MLPFVARRLAALVVVLLGMSLVTFVITNLLPADPARVSAGPHASNADVERVRRELGLDRPLYIQYAVYVRNLATGNLGTSVRSRQPIAAEIRRHIAATVELTLVAIVVYVAIAVPLGVIAAAHRAGWVDSLTRLGAVGGSAVAPFWLALLLQLVFYRMLAWLPAGGRLPLDVPPPPAVTGLFLVDSLLAGDLHTLGIAARHMVMPVTALALGRLGLTTRMTRAQMVLELAQDYVRTARAKGQAERVVLYRHALQNALNPIVTMVGIQTAYLLSGTVLVEGIFRWPGLGQYALDAIIEMDVPAVLGVALTSSLFFVLVNLAVDVFYATMDPRVRVS
ncbi:MAG: ABC transporter permease [Armatimonadetes bacterium]|nr:ABC transporter permease [Armatimonadota bacterium]